MVKTENTKPANNVGRLYVVLTSINVVFDIRSISSGPYHNVYLGLPVSLKYVVLKRSQLNTRPANIRKIDFEEFYKHEPHAAPSHFEFETPIELDTYLWKADLEN